MTGKKVSLFKAKFKQLFIMTMKPRMKKINYHIYSFFNYLCKETFSFSNGNLETYLNTISFPKLTKENSETLDGGTTEKELLIALESMENNKSGNDGLTKEFYITFWNELKMPLLLAIEKAHLVKQLSAS